jgi:hypothetical protein
MPDWMQAVFNDGPAIELPALFARLGAAFALGAAVALVYAATHHGDATYHPGFVTTLVLLSILIAVVTQVIGENVARAFSLVGALAIVRFRTVVADTRDTAFVIFAVVVGMAAGAGQIEVALAGLVVGGAAAFIVRPRGIRALPAWRLTVRIGIGQDRAQLDSILGRACASRELRASSTTRQGAAIEMTYDVRLSESSSPAAVIADLNGLPGIQQAELTRV